MLGGLGLAGAGLALGGAAAVGTRSARRPGRCRGCRRSAIAEQPEPHLPFYGDHQAGIVTPAQDRLAFATFNVLPGTTRGDLRDLLRDWTTAAARMTQGQLVGEDTDLDEPAARHR